jgi:hypothetical protein
MAAVFPTRPQPEPRIPGFIQCDKWRWSPLVLTTGENGVVSFRAFSVLLCAVGSFGES